MKNKSPKTKKGKQRISVNQAWPLIQPDAAGVDLGSREHWVAVPEGRSAQSVRRFGTFTADLERLEPGTQHINGGIPGTAPDAYLVVLRQWLALHNVDLAVMYIFEETRSSQSVFNVFQYVSSPVSR